MHDEIIDGLIKQAMDFRKENLLPLCAKFATLRDEIEEQIVSESGLIWRNPEHRDRIKDLRQDAGRKAAEQLPEGDNAHDWTGKFGFNIPYALQKMKSAKTKNSFDEEKQNLSKAIDLALVQCGDKDHGMFKSVREACSSILSDAIKLEFTHLQTSNPERKR